MDLSKIKAIYTGGELISINIISKFSEMLVPYGFKYNCILPAYGLSEATLGVTSGKLYEGPQRVNIHKRDLYHGKVAGFLDDGSSEDMVSFVRVGAAFEGCNIRICNTDYKIAEENEIGLIQVRGNNVMKGYSDGGGSVFTQDNWLETGDLGFITNGELVIVGRQKDVIIHNAKNYYCSDIEDKISASVDINREQLTVCYEYNEEKYTDEIVVYILQGAVEEDNYKKVSSQIRELVAMNFGLTVSKIAIVNDIPTTESGKIQKYKLMQGSACYIL